MPDQPLDNTPRTYPVWGADIDESAHAQMEAAMRLPVARAGALMPDAHVGYGLPIGGVLAAENAVIPYAVGVDIACRMMMTVYDLPAERIDKDRQRLENILTRNTLFGAGQAYQPKHRIQHDVMDLDWTISPITSRVKDKAWGQLGTSGSGNHFVEFGELEVLALPSESSGAQSSELFEALRGVPSVAASPGAGTHDNRNQRRTDATAPAPPSPRRLAILSHSGSRGPGAMIAAHYSKLARERHPDLPKDLAYLAWLDLDSAEGQEYWHAMQLMGAFASANHHIIHAKIERDLKQMGARPIFQVENHHNYAWQEEHEINGQKRTLIVHRKGATPAGRGTLGLIPGSMAAPGYLVEGLGEPRSLNSASHGAGRRLSRTKTRESTRWSHVKQLLAEKNVTLLSAGLDEAPLAYKDIDEVMAAQSDLVRPLARFTPRIVRMAPDGEKPED